MSRAHAPLIEGALAPAFDLPDQHGRVHGLRDYRGRWVVLYFYPKDATPLCTAEACAFRDANRALQDMDAVVIGVSRDAPATHARFAAQHRLGFSLLCDAAGSTARAYGALWRLGPLRFVRRHSFLIDPHGRIARIYRRIDPARHAHQVLDDLRALHGTAG